MFCSIWIVVGRDARSTAALGPDGRIYGVTSTCIYRLDPASLEVTVVVRVTDGISVAGPIVGKWLYFATGHRLRAADIL